MLNKSEKEKRNKLKKSYKANEKEQILATLPISFEQLKELFNWLDMQLETHDCDNTLRLTQIFIGQNNLPEETFLEWLENQGGYCDCEVLANVP
ncbi:MAG TPA: DUF2695 domain-containing protein [Pyrinomonadaceae bacterium]|jgi:hypothetical protein|nr:DUF2695 domain-containing protein [Pyrinomonadaceae bacterium]